MVVGVRHRRARWLVVRTPGAFPHGPCRCRFVRLRQFCLARLGPRAARARAARDLFCGAAFRLAPGPACSNGDLCSFAYPVQRPVAGSLGRPDRLRGVPVAARALFRLGGQAPYRFAHWDGAWARLISLGLLIAMAASLAPAVLLLVPIIALALLVGSLLTGPRQGAARFLVASLVATALAFVGLLPWSVGLLRSSAALLGSPSGAGHALSVSQLLRLQTGPFGGGPLGWAVIAAAAVPLFIGRSWRMAWAARLWVVAFTCLSLAWAGSRGWFPMPQLELVLAPAGAALALAVAVGAAAVEVDLSGYRFGWRQFAPAFGALAVVAASLPFLSWVGGGQWGLPASGAEASFAFPSGSQAGDYRVLWVGAVGSIPLAQQGTAGDLGFATSLDGLPLASQLWAPDAAGYAQLVAQDLRWAERNETTGLGHMFASLAVRYVVVPVGGPGAEQADLPVLDALDRQVDLVPVGTDSSYRVFANAAWVPVFSVLSGNAPAGSAPPQAASRRG